ncbi:MULTISPECIES: hypothetical protein [unclassified Lactobacillus]|uniref:hypothetical protein n=1 Tax=unclassified Lactobacillus TaxID=2620435 RepID=UPI0022699B42|nr:MULTISPECIES: hypothetical protein [unclassified Lactobacillus]MCX8721238.1 hypothetical protein [Lactobacillus sp. B4010]MCX8731936.1 hypothetical protein [Lactobacillus sp. B4015]MCX8734377.1 hypothetical protein [Lactobacillus sp. B4012]
MKILKTPKLPKNNKFKKIDSKLSLKIDRKYSSKFANNSDLIISIQPVDKEKVSYLIVKSSIEINRINPGQLLEQFLLINLEKMIVVDGPDSIENLISHLETFSLHADFYGLNRVKKTIPLHILKSK